MNSKSQNSSSKPSRSVRSETLGRSYLGAKIPLHLQTCGTRQQVVCFPSTMWGWHRIDIPIPKRRYGKKKGIMGPKQIWKAAGQISLNLKTCASTVARYFILRFIRMELHPLNREQQPWPLALRREPLGLQWPWNLPGLWSTIIVILPVSRRIWYICSQTVLSAISCLLNPRSLTAFLNCAPSLTLFNASCWCFCWIHRLPPF